jgi:predicted 3-demethylubiquinone-9 3-methyltransferase (glyoxalase superfamily)
MKLETDIVLLIMIINKIYGGAYMQKIVPYLWFDKEALEAAKWYVSLFENSSVLNINHLSGTPSGDVEMVDFQLENLNFSAISAGPYFSFNSSISLMVACSSKEEVDRLYSHLSVGGIDLMPLDEYPFSKRYAWIRDRYGLNWQLFMVEDMSEHKRIRPSLLFSSKVCGKAEEAIEYYLTVFEESSKGFINKYAPKEAEDERAKINYAELNIQGLQMIMMDHGMGGEDAFNEAFSFVIPCDTQEEIDYYWAKLSHVPEAEQCGWVKDQFGVSWQIVPSRMDKIFSKGTEEEVARVTEAFLKMKKFDIEALEKARLGI